MTMDEQPMSQPPTDDATDLEPGPHEQEPHEQGVGNRLNWLRAGVLGANDGIVSTASLVVGVAGATSSKSAILIAGVAGLVAGAMSMGAGEYVSVSTQRDSEKALLAKERRELEEDPEDELAELTYLYIKRGLSEDLAHEVATQLTERDALAAHAEVELGIDPDELDQPGPGRPGLDDRIHRRRHPPAADHHLDARVDPVVGDGHLGRSGPRCDRMGECAPGLWTRRQGDRAQRRRRSARDGHHPPDRLPRRYDGRLTGLAVTSSIGIRSRILGVAVAILVVTLAIWAWVVITVFDGTLTRTARNHAEFQATQLADQLRSIPVDQVVPEGKGYGDLVLQVLATDGTVVASSEPLSGPITNLRPGLGEMRSQTVAGVSGVDDDSFVVVARGTVGLNDESLIVAVANPVHVEEGTISRIVLVGGAAGLLVLGITTILVNWAVGAALSPVERLRGQLAVIDGHTFGDRVAVPATGDELTRLGDTMNQMLERLEAAYAAQKAFVSDASHELRSPLATIRAAVELASADPTGRVWEETRTTLMAEILRLQSLVDDLLTLSKVDAGALPLRRRECDLDDVVVTAVRNLGADSGRAIGVTVEPVRALADPDRLAQVMRNLLDNASRHATSRVRVTLARSGATAIISVDNDGPPVPEEKRATVFERFVRLDETRDRDSGGSGLGLAIVADLVHAHGGTVLATESDDGWCRFEFTLPLQPVSQRG